MGDITRSPRWANWVLAVAFGLCLAIGEGGHVYAAEAGLGLLVTGMMVAVAATSMVLNCWAFVKHPAGGR